MRLPRKSTHSENKKGSEKTESWIKTIQSISASHLRGMLSVTKHKISST